MLHKDFKEFLELLILHHVEYLIVDGYAVGAYGHPRYTGDLDVWINRTPLNATKVFECLNEFGFGLSGLDNNLFMKENQVVQLGYPPIRIDLPTNIEGVMFDDAYNNKSRFEMDGLMVNFISFQDLVKNKTATGRPIDLDDIENLKK